MALVIIVGSALGAPDDRQSTSVAARAINALGIELLRQTAKPDANALLSPYSIQSALAMAYAGAEGDTRDEMARVLHYPKDESQLHSSFTALRKSLDEVVMQSAKYAENSVAIGKMARPADPIVLNVASRLFGQSGYDFRPAFLRLLRDDYAAPFQPVDFIHGSTDAMKLINDWIANQTQQHIRDVIPQGALGTLSRLVLVNAVYFKAPWKKRFLEGATKPAPFHLNGNAAVDVATMTQTEELGYAKGDGFCALELPYIGTRLRFIVILPHNVDGLAAVEKNFTFEAVTSQLRWEERYVTIHMPKFVMEPAPLSLGEALQNLGMKKAFDQPEGSADFSRMTPQPGTNDLFISQLLQKAILSIDENGSIAATAAYQAFATRGGIRENLKPVEVRVDHPFLFLIEHTGSRACLFLGHLTDPR